jgi:hypothetical protein
MALQSSFGTTLPTGLPGQIANGELQNRITRTIEDAGGVAFGKAVFEGSGDHGCTATPNANPLGVVMADHALVRHTGNAADTFAQYDDVPIMQRGTIWVLASANVAKRDQVYVTPAGLFTNAAGGGANLALGNFKFGMTVVNGAMCRITNNRS